MEFLIDDFAATPLDVKATFIYRQLGLHDLVNHNINFIESLGFKNRININPADGSLYRLRPILQIVALNLLNPVVNADVDGLILQQRVLNILEIIVEQTIFFNTMVVDFIKRGGNIRKNIETVLNHVKNNFKMIVKQRKLLEIRIDEKFVIRRLFLDKKIIDENIQKLNYNRFI